MDVWMMEEAPKGHRWFQFRLRTLLVAILLLSLPLSWFAVWAKRAAKQRTIVTAIERHGGHVVYEGQFASQTERSWLRRVLGRDFFDEVLQVGFFGPDEGRPLQQLKELASLTALLMDSIQIDEAELKHLGELTNVEYLSLNHAQITDAGLQHLVGLKNLESLFLYNTAVTPEGVELLQEALPHCRIEY
jgi:hypothetical protein